MANKSKDFQFNEMAVAAIKVVDSVRSRGKVGTIIPAESRINAFYRAIGLPATVEEPEKGEEDKRDPLQVGNVFPSSQLNYETYRAGIRTREAACLLPIKDEDRKKFLYFHTAKPSSGLGAKGADSKKNDRKSGVLRPFVVNGGAEIYPQNRRVRGAFFPERQLNIAGVTYKRPLLETIILMKLKGQGVSNSSTGFSIGAGGALSNLIDQLSINIEDAIKSIPDMITSAALDLEKATVETKIDIIPNECNIAEAHPKSEVRDEENVGASDKMSIKQKQRRAVKEAMLSLFEFDDTFGDGVNNMKAGLFASEVLLGSATVEEAGSEETNKEETEMKKESAVKKVKQAYKTLDLTLGTFSGLSGIDMLVVIAALMKMETTDLMGLLNRAAILRLQGIKGTGITSGVPDVVSALGILEAKAEEFFNLLDTWLKKQTHSDHPVNQEQQDT